ncbi:MAG TPA: aminodeoxychorismate synthase component I [Luteolibacter sp.]|nr:aminodeoxychorismate synthase component I [Luteolibacter sp.]
MKPPSRATLPVRNPRLDGLAPVEVAARLGHLPGLVFLDSSGNLPGSAGPAVSLIAAQPERLISGSIHHPAHRAILRQAHNAIPAVTGDHGFPLGGLCGWISYEGHFHFGSYPAMLAFDHSSQSWWELGSLSAQLREPETREQPAIGEFKACWPRESFTAAVERIQEWIRAGDIYQANLAQAFEATVQGGSLFGLYELLRDASPAPMSVWMSLGGRELLSSSPETFLRVSGRQIQTHPIKGTRPRHHNPDEDRRLAYELQTSPKEIAELVMITDLLRNDLGQVCEFGSVEVSEMLQLETLEQVHHLVSTVRGTLREENDTLEALAACFPGGSITGAPKKRAMEIIAEVEGRPRGIYCGTIGCLGANGESRFNIAIRTLVRQGYRLSYHVGAGIVADSDPEREYEETLHKAAGIRLAIERWDG